MILCNGSSAHCCTSRSRNQSNDMYPWIHASGSTTRSEFSCLPCSIARTIRAVLPSKSPLVVFICPIVTRIYVCSVQIVHDPCRPRNSAPFEQKSVGALYSEGHPCGGVA